MEKDVREKIKDFDIPNPFKMRAVVDIEFCVGIEELKETLHVINQCEYTFITATQDGDTYTVFFRRAV